MKLSERDLEQRYRDVLDAVYPECKIAGYTYSTSHALEEIDPTAFRCGFNDWLDSELGETVWENGDGEYFDSEDDATGENESRCDCRQFQNLGHCDHVS